MQDIHTHLYWESFDEDREEVLNRAKQAGVTKMLVVGTNIEENKKVLELAQGYDSLWASVGVHPNEFRSSVSEHWKETLATQANESKVVAIGECGLDYSQSHGLITDVQKEDQKQGFIQQLALAEEKGLPVIVHCRAVSAESDEAYWDLLTILKDWSPKLSNVILHCYMGSVSVTKEFLTLQNVYFSFTGNITYPIKKTLAGGNFDLTEVVKTVLGERIFIETDCPFLAPQEHRGERNEPAFVVAVGEKIAEIHKISIEEVVRLIEANFKKVFNVEH